MPHPAPAAARSKKRTKRAASSSKPKPASSSKSKAALDYDAEEEQDLEARLFGARKPKQARVSYRDDDESDEGETGLGWMQDSELFTVDLPTQPRRGREDGSVSEDDLEATIEYPENYIDDNDSEDDNDSDDDDKEEAGRDGGKCVWHDPADDAVAVSLQDNKRLRKLARGKAQQQDRVSGNDLQKKLREQFERLHPKPQWASRRVDAGVPSMQKLLSSTASFVAAEDRRDPLPPTHIDIQRMRNANEQNPTAGKKKASDAGAGVVDVAWHPNTKVSVMAVAGGDRRVRLFNIDGHTNAPLLTLHIPSLPLSRATWHPSGSSLLLTGNRPYYYVYDLASQRCLRSPRNLFGSVETPTTPNSLARHAFSPDGTLLAVAGRRGAVSVLEWGAQGSTGVVVAELRSGRGGTVADMVWSKDSAQLSVLGGRTGSDVELWDIAERRVVTQWKDDRAFGGLLMRQSYAGDYTAIGASTGIVNLYQTSTLPGASKKRGQVEPWRSLEHLTTPISAMAFHPTGEMLVSASTAKKDALKLYHLPSGTAFSNWPTPATPLGRVSSVGFSSGGEYLAVGNTRGAVLLWSLKHYA